MHAAPLAVLRAIPGLRLRLLPGSDRCCGSAGIYSLLQPAMSRAVLDAKIAAFAAADPRPDIVATGNPGLPHADRRRPARGRAADRVAHPVELLDWVRRRVYAAVGRARSVEMQGPLSPHVPPATQSILLGHGLRHPLRLQWCHRRRRAQHCEALIATLAEYGYPLDRETYYREYLGFDDRECFRFTFERDGRDGR